MQVPFRGLRAFCTAARLSSFKDAADELCLTASAVSHQIKALEAQLGVALFERRTRAVMLTDDGRALLARVQPHMQAIERSVREFRARPSRRPLVVRMPEFFASELFMPKVPAFSGAHRDIDLRVETTGPGAGPSGRADVNIVLSAIDPGGAASRPLFAIRYVPACSPALHRQLAGAGPAALARTTLLVHHARPAAWRQWAGLVGSADALPKQIIRLDSMFALARAAEQGVGVALIPMPMSRAWFRDGRLRRLFDRDLESRDRYFAVVGSDSEHPEAARTLWQWIVETYAGYDKSDDMIEISSSVGG